MASIDSFLGSSLQNLNTLDKKIANDGSDENMKKVVEYLYTLTEQLRYMFNNLDTENFTDGVFHRTIRDETTQQYTQIVQTNDALTAIVAGLNAAQKAAKLTFDAEGLSIQNGGFKILDENNNTTMSVSNSGNVSIVGTYTTEEESQSGNLWKAILSGGKLRFYKGSTTVGGIAYSALENGLCLTGMAHYVNDKPVLSAGDYWACLSQEATSLGGLLLLRNSAKTYNGVYANGQGTDNNGYIYIRNTSTDKSTGYLGGDGSGHGRLYLYNSAGTTLVAVGRNTEGHGYFNCSNSNGNVVVFCTTASGHGYLGVRSSGGTALAGMGADGNAAGYLYSYNASGTLTGFINNSSGHGQMALRNSSGTNMVVLGRASFGGGSIDLRNSSGSIKAVMSIDSYGGYLSLKNSSNNAGVDIKVLDTGCGSFVLRNSSGTGYVTAQVISNQGYVWADHYNNNSSRRYKKDITDMSDEQAQKLLDLKFVKFKYKDRDTYNYGLIAEDTDIEEIVTLDEKGRPDAIDYTKLIPYMGKLIQEQDKRIKALEMKQ